MFQEMQQTLVYLYGFLFCGHLQQWKGKVCWLSETSESNQLLYLKKIGCTDLA